MVAGGLPTLTVLLDDGTGTFPYDISAFARLQEGYSGRRGRGDELSEVEAGDLAVALDNTDGRFTLGSTIIATPSPIKMDQRIRVKLTANAVAVNRFTQHVQNWPVEWPSGDDGFAVANISATDVQAKLEADRHPLRSVIQEEFALDAPSVLYALGEPAGSPSAADSSGNQGSALVPGTGGGYPYGTVVFGDAIGTLPAVRLNSAGVSVGTVYSPASLAGPAPSASFADVCFAFSAVSLASTTTTMLALGDTVGRGFGQFQVHGSLGILEFWINGGGGGTGLGSTGHRVDDGLLHVAEVQYASGTWKLYLDGSLVDSIAAAAPTGAASIQLQNDNANTGATIRIADLALFPTAVSAARAASHAQALLTGFAGESGTARITRLAGYASVPVGTLDTSLTNVAFEDFTDKSIADELRNVADAEFGLVFVDGSGNLTFHNRNRAVSKLTPDVTIDANFLAEGTRFEVDMQGVLNYFETTAVGTSVTQLVRNTTSEVTNKHGRYKGSKTYLVSTNAEALDRANWVVYTHAEPSPRVGSLVVDVLTMTAAQQAAMLTLEPDSWLRVIGLPGQTPGSTTADFIVEGFAESLNTGAWTLTFNAANKAVAAPTPWILGDATYGVLGSTTRLYV